MLVLMVGWSVLFSANRVEAGPAGGSKAEIQSVRSPYRIRPGDLLTVWVYKVKEFNMDLRVTPSGYLFLPLVGKVSVKGQTLDSLTELIKKELIAKAKLLNPMVTLSVKEFAKEYAYIYGGVRDPKTFELPTKREMTLSQAVAIAGGLNKDALPKEMRVTRILGDGSKKEMVLDFTSVMRGGHPEMDIALEPGDSIFVPRSGGFFVLGGVKKPGYYESEKLAGAFQSVSLTASRALALSEGLAPGAVAEDAKVIRYPDNGPPEIYPVNLHALVSQGRPSEDVRMQPGDTLFVPQGDGIYVLGSVKRGGVYYPPSGGRLTVSKALSMAGGFEKFAKANSVRVIGKRGVKEIDVKALTGPEGDPKKDIVLEAGDVVFVPKSF